MANYQINRTINGYTIVDTESKKPITPIYFVAYSRDNTAYSKANEICQAMIEDKDMQPYEGYKSKSIK